MRNLRFWAISLKLACLLSVLYLWQDQFLARIGLIDGYFLVVVYFVMALFYWGLLVGAAFIPVFSLRLIAGVPLSLGGLVGDSYFSVMGQFLEYPGFSLLLIEIGSAADVFAQFGADLLIPGLSAVLLFFGLILPWRRRRTGISALLILSTALPPLGAVLFLAVMIVVRSGGGGSGLPNGFPVIAYGLLSAVEAAGEVAAVRSGVVLEPENVRQEAGDIVLIIDESVRGDYLKLNAEQGVPISVEGRPDLINYGFAVSATNCSAGANAAIRFGGRRGMVRHMLKQGPYLWQYARQAGFYTVYIDGQRTGRKLQNYVTEDELDHVDSFVQFDAVPVMEREMKAVEIIAELSRDGKRDLIVLNKVGAHFPVSDKYPDAYHIHRPALARGAMGGITDLSSNQEDGRDWQRYINSYKNTISWMTGAFFEQLITTADMTRVEILYTSDHGQNFHEDGRPGGGTHCFADAAPGEGLVPLFILSGREEVRQKLRQVLDRNFDASSHYNIFPTLLLMMGYPRIAVEEIYGPSLFSPVKDPLTFNSTFKTGILAEDTWIRLHPAEFRR